MSEIMFTPEKFAALKRAYARAIAERRETFMFEGRELLVDYAKYMIMYLEDRFGA